MTAVFTIGFFKSRYLLLAFLAAFTVGAILITPIRTRIIGALTIDETSMARITSWENAIDIFSKNPFFGVGFNNYRLAQQKYEILEPTQTGGHSGSGSDSSVLLIAATTGTYGLFFFLIFLFSIFLSLVKGLKKDAASLSAFASFLALLVHTQFVNSFFFPQTMILFWFVLAQGIKNDN